MDAKTFNKLASEAVLSDATDSIDSFFSNKPAGKAGLTKIFDLISHREKFTSEFRMQLDKVSFPDAVLYNFLGTIHFHFETLSGGAREPISLSEEEKLNDDFLISIEGMTFPVISLETVQSPLKELLYNSAQRVLNLIDSGAYLYAGQERGGLPIPETTIEFREFKAKVDSLERKFEISEDPLAPLYDFDSYFVSRSEMNVVTLFNSSRSSTPESHRVVRKTAFRGYLDTAFSRPAGNETSPQERRELILKGWMIGKDLTIGDKIPNETQKSLWKKLEQTMPNEFSNKVGEPLSSHAATQFFKICSAKGICRFR